MLTYADVCSYAGDVQDLQHMSKRYAASQFVLTYADVCSYTGDVQDLQHMSKLCGIKVWVQGLVNEEVFTRALTYADVC
jgi:hypothetical protein